MIAADYIVEKLIDYGVTDAFGIPGGVILKLLYAMEQKQNLLTPHLNYHEQMAGFAACGYAQASGKLGVAYATRGPGITNMITCIAEAYQESLPVLFITAHANRNSENGMRFQYNQEFDIIKSVSAFVKYGDKVDTVEELAFKLNKACEFALEGRKGPVILDIASHVFDMEMKDIASTEPQKILKENVKCVVKKIKEKLNNSQRPVILIGDGLRHAGNQEELIALADQLKIPILSSRASQDLVITSEYYFGYIGSHGIRYSNFIISKADLIITVGNRLAFPIESKSFSPIVKSKEIIRLDIDENEFKREIPNASNYVVDVKKLVDEIKGRSVSDSRFEKWRRICDDLKEELKEYDISDVVVKLQTYLKKQEEDRLYVCDVGNNEFWFSRAFEYVGKRNQVLYSKSYGTLGVALGRAIGAYYATKKEVICVIGDQGFQYNIQELQYIVKWKIPVKIVLINNYASQMILDHEIRILQGAKIHVDAESGYGVPNFKKIVEGYGMIYAESEDIAIHMDNTVLEYTCDAEERLIPNLPKGNVCQNMEPAIEKKKYLRLDKM